MAACKLLINSLAIEECEKRFGHLCDYEIFNRLPEIVYNGFLQNMLFLSTDRNNVFIYGAQQKLCSNYTSYDIIVNEFNKMAMIGGILDIHVSDNGMHFMASITRQRWELQTIQRYQEVCDLLKKDSNNVFLEAFKDQCRDQPPRVRVLISFFNIF